MNLVGLHALSAATSAGFLVVYAIVNLANLKLAKETQSHAWISLLAAFACVAALTVMIAQIAADPATRSSAYAVAGIIVLALVIEFATKVALRKADTI